MQKLPASSDIRPFMEDMQKDKSNDRFGLPVHEKFQEMPLATLTYKLVSNIFQDEAPKE